jgi:prepilin-type processing-associated H-X9-DG protein
MRRIRATGGFSVFEALIIVTVLANVAAVLYPVFFKAAENARSTTCQSNLKQIAVAFQMYVQDYGAYPCNTTCGGWCDMHTPLSAQVYGYINPGWITNSFEPTCSRGLLSKYNSNDNIWACPTDAMGASTAFPVCTNYAKLIADMQNGIYHRASSYIYRRALWYRYDNLQPGGIPSGFFVHPSRIVAFYELYPWHHYVHIAHFLNKNDPFDTTPGSEWADVDPSSMLNCLFLDGHVAMENWGTVFSPPGYPVDFGKSDGTGSVSGGTWSTDLFQHLYDVN